MTEYIRRSDALLFALFCIRNIFDSNVSLDDKFKEIPSADVAPVRRAIWKTESLWQPESLHFNYCSLCNKPSLMMTDFCPNCGAIMNKEEKDG